MTDLRNEKYVDNLFKHAEIIFELGFDDNGACTALAYSQRLKDRCEYFRKEMEALGMETRYDIMGNLYGVLPGVVLKKIVVLSHLDSVFDAGRYDGVLGVVLPLEYVRWLKDNNQKLHYSLEILVCMGEESPGVTATFGSKSITGGYNLNTIKAMYLAYDPKVNVSEAIKNFFSDPKKELTKENLAESQLKTDTYFKALEVHIEQYYLLKNRAEAGNGKPHIGLMRGVGGHIRATVNLSDSEFKSKQVEGLKVTFHGETGHSGATPMGENHRKDALLKAAQFIAVMATQDFEVLFGGLEVKEPSTTSIPNEVDVFISVKPEFKSEIEQLLTGENILINHTIISFQIVSNKLMFRLSEIVLTLNQAAINAPQTDEVRATITKALVNQNGGYCYCDIRGASLNGMEVLLNSIKDLTLLSGVKTKLKVISQKKPIIFNSTQLEAEVLEKQFEGRVMKGMISVPGQDIGVLSAFGIDSSLFFIESGTGHHPDEYVRKEAMEQAFFGVKEIINCWDSIKK